MQGCLSGTVAGVRVGGWNALNGVRVCAGVRQDEAELGTYFLRLPSSATSDLHP